MDRDALKAGKDRVAEILIKPLNERFQLHRGRGVTEAKHLDRMQELQARLAYLDEPDLIALREAVIARLRPRRGGVWPAVADILAHANVIRLPPPSDSPMVTSYMTSSAGARAREEGCHVELYIHLKEHGRVPMTTFEWKQIRDRGADNQRRRALIRENRAAGWIIGSEDEIWLRKYAHMTERAEALLAQEGAEA